MLNTSKDGRNYPVELACCRGLNLEEALCITLSTSFTDTSSRESSGNCVDDLLPLGTLVTNSIPVLIIHLIFLYFLWDLMCLFSFCRDGLCLLSERNCLVSLFGNEVSSRFIIVLGDIWQNIS